MGFLSNALLVGLAAFAASTILKQKLSDGDLERNQVSCTDFPSLCDTPKTGSVAEYRKGASFGRWREPPSHVSFPADVYPNQFWKLKRWHYTAVSFEDYFFAFGIVNFNYIGDVFVYVVDRKTNEKIEYHVQRPLAVGIDFAESSIQGCSSVLKTPYLSSDKSIEVCYNSDGYWHIKADLEGYSDKNYAKVPLVADIKVFKEANDALAFSYPLGGSSKRPVFCHKSAGMKAEGSITVGAPENQGKKVGSAGIDWTHSLALHHTKWKWVSFNNVSPVTRLHSDGTESAETTSHVGINLSKDVYDAQSKSGSVLSIENAFWVDGRAVPLRFPVEIIMPENGELGGPWRIKSTNPNKEENIDLHFMPISAREDHLDLSLVTGLLSDFVQPYGIFSGSVTILDVELGITFTAKIENTFGVVENHDAMW